MNPCQEIISVNPEISFSSSILGKRETQGALTLNPLPYTLRPEAKWGNVDEYWEPSSVMLPPSAHLLELLEVRVKPKTLTNHKP